MLNGGMRIPIAIDSPARRVAEHAAPSLCRYEMRRECQEILPNLYLGPFVASKSLDVLQSLKITHMYVFLFVATVAAAGVPLPPARLLMA